MKCKEVIDDDISRDEEGSIINDDTMPTNDDDGQGQNVTTDAHDRCAVPLANETTDSNAGNTKNEESTTKKKRRARNKTVSVSSEGPQS